ncbi:MAG: four helix bundle protein [Candidatus Cloacimonetes bacterium]|nr:four helix bundle protein [Candidatus Cloacimonadota bacterium]
MAGRYSYEKLEVYQRSYQLAVEIHKLSLKLPRTLQFDLADQIRRASRSIPSNIAEGLGRNRSRKDKINFLINALGSNDEMLFNLQFMKDTQLMSGALFQKLHEKYIICGKQLSQLIKVLKEQSTNH